MTPVETLILASYFFVLLILAVYGWHRYYLVYAYMKHKHEQPVPHFTLDPLPVVTASADGRLVVSPSGEVKITSYEAERVVMTVTARRNAMLVLADSYFPGWQARLDGRETPMYRADYRFRAIYVPVGAHTIEFIYTSRPFLIGTAISLAVAAGAVIVIGLLVVQRKPENGNG